jgi:hypothetical protein
VTIGLEFKIHFLLEKRTDLYREIQVKGASEKKKWIWNQELSGKRLARPDDSRKATRRSGTIGA